MTEFFLLSGVGVKNTPYHLLSPSFYKSKCLPLRTETCIAFTLQMASIKENSHLLFLLALLPSRLVKTLHWVTLA